MINLAALSIVIQDVDAGIDPDELEKGCAALQRQVMEHITPAWGTWATVRPATADNPPRATEVVIKLMKVPGPDQQGELGDHNETATGVPDAFVFPALAAQDGATWTSVCSHEISELLADPFLNRCAQAPDGKIWAVEVADAVEELSYEIDGFKMSDFCLPAWFSPPQDDPGVVYDYMGKCDRPFQVLTGGYGQTYDPQNGWSQVGAMRAYRIALRDMKLSRGTKRRKLSRT